jgi:hypothetical protein
MPIWSINSAREASGPARGSLSLTPVLTGGLGAGLWLWSALTPAARVLAPDGGIVYLRGRPPWPPGVAILAGVAAVVCVWLVVASLVARRLHGRTTIWRAPLVPSRAALAATAPIVLPFALLGFVAVAWWRPLGALTEPASVLLDDGRWVLLGGVALAVPLRAGSLALAGDPARPAADGAARRTALLVFVAVALVNLSLLPRAILVGPTGDEPDYLLLAHSLVVDRDLDLRNQITQKDYLRFTPRLQPHVRPGPAGGLYTAHRPGLPVLIAPAYALGLATGWSVRLLVTMAFALLAAWLAARIASWAAALTGHWPSAVAATLGVALTAPGLFYAFTIYPELPAAVVVLEVLRFVGQGAGGHPWVYGLLVALLPWLHEKFIPLAVVLALAAAMASQGRRATLIGFAIPLGVSAVLQAAYYIRLYGSPVPFGAHAGFAPWPKFLQGHVGLLLDRDHGLLMLAPLFLVAVAGLGAFRREAPHVAGSALAACLSLYFVVGTYQEWWGGFAPAPRYLVPLLGPLGVALAFGLREWSRRGFGLRASLLAAASVAVAMAAAIYPALQYRHAHPVRSLLPGIDWTRYLPAWLAPDARTGALTALAIALAALLLLAGRRRRDRHPSDGSARALAPGGGETPGAATAWRSAGVQLTGAGLVTLVVAGLAVMAGARWSGSPAPLSVELSNAELHRLIHRTAARGAGPWTVTARPVVPPDAVRLVYPVSRLYGHGRMVPDALTVVGEARIAQRAGTDVVFGPHETLPPGAYLVRFRIRLARAIEGAIATIGVTSARGRVRLAVDEVRAEALAIDAYRDVTLEFRIAATTPDLEWRMRSAVEDAVLVEGVTVTPLDLRLAAWPVP